MNADKELVGLVVLILVIAVASIGAFVAGQALLVQNCRTLGKFYIERDSEAVVFECREVKAEGKEGL